MTATRDRTLSTATFPNVRGQQITDEEIRERATLDGDVDLTTVISTDSEINLRNSIVDDADLGILAQFEPINPEEVVTEDEYTPANGFIYTDDELRAAVAEWNSIFPDNRLSYSAVTLGRSAILAECHANHASNVGELCAAQLVRLMGNLSRRLKVASS